MITLRSNDPNKPVETTMALAGQEFPITLLPLTPEDDQAAFSPFQKRRGLPNQQTGKMEFVDYFDSRAKNDKGKTLQEVSDDILDKHVIDFSGINGNDGQLLDGTKRGNKILLGKVNIEDIEEVRVIDSETKEVSIVMRPRDRSFRTIIFEKCRELAHTVAEAEEKNS